MQPSTTHQAKAAAETVQEIAEPAIAQAKGIAEEGLDQAKQAAKTAQEAAQPAIAQAKGIAGEGLDHAKAVAKEATAGFKDVLKNRLQRRPQDTSSRCACAGRAPGVFPMRAGKCI